MVCSAFKDKSSTSIRRALFITAPHLIPMPLCDCLSNWAGNLHVFGVRERRCNKSADCSLFWFRESEMEMLGMHVMP